MPICKPLTVLINKMKILIPLIIFFITWSCHAQPTGSARIYLEIHDNGDTLHFENCFHPNEQGRKTTLHYKKYKLIDISTNPTGFNFHSRDKYIHKTFMEKHHYIQIIKNKKDTMSIEMLNAYNRYFLSIPFQKGNFRLSINDGKLHKWNYNTLPYKRVNTEGFIYDITPTDWTVFRVDNSKLEQAYFLSDQFAKQHILVKPILPEDDPNFRNPRRISHLKKEVEDYNFDGNKDYREQRFNDTTKWNFFLYKDSIIGYELDTFLSNLDHTYFDFEKKTFSGFKTTKMNSGLTQIDTFQYLEGKPILVRQMKCEPISPNSTKMDCSVYLLENGELVLKQRLTASE